MIRDLYRLLGPHHTGELRRAPALLVAAAALQGAALAVLLPVLRGLADDTLPLRWLALLAVLAAAYGLVSYLGVRTSRRSGYTLARTLHSRIGDHVVRLPLGWFTRARTGSLGRLVTQHVMNVMGAVGHLTEPLITAVVGPAAVVTVLLCTDWRLGLAALATAPPLVLAYLWTGRLVRRTDQATDAAASRSAAMVVEFAQQQQVLRAYGRTVHGLRTLDDALVAQYRATRRMLRTAMPGLAGFGLATQVAFGVLLAVSVAHGLGAETDPPTLVFLLVLLVRYTEPVAAAAELGAAVRMAKSSLDRVTDLLATPVLPEPARPVPPRGADIELDRVSLSHGETRALNEVSLRVPAGTMTAVVGPSGAGKTTLLRLIARFMDPDAGQVRVGGVDVRSRATDELMADLAVVFQDVYLFEGTLEENIRVGRDGATAEQVRHAASLARVDEIAERLPDGLATRVGEGGATLSGGERQRVSLARALLKDAPVVLIDEGTSALDAENESEIVAALADLARHRTVVVVAHRLETVRHADQIVVLEAGGIVERGRHEELVGLGGRYADFWDRRERARGWRLAPKTPPDVR
ncbi:ABC transporter ATP-binding protein [Streptomyces sp. NPDC049881]|uniref:ABC transporter ATP-binding protein n=1 Tax=Streptomyces sp. NPDC049881 TaxID=3155778 RepID=UPI00342F761A